MERGGIILKILSIDTASDVCGVSILEDFKLIKQLDSNTGRTHSENLMPMIQNIFSECNLSLKDIDLLVCDKGPGSFTGIRIGVATVKAFHDSLNIPCIGISSLEALAYNLINYINSNSYICSMIDCKNNNCYYAIYEYKDNKIIEISEPIADNLEDILNKLPTYRNITFIGDASIIYKDTLLSKFPDLKFNPESKNFLNSHSLGIAGLNKFINNNKVSENILPLYIKKPQAQKLLEEKEQNGD